MLGDLGRDFQPADIGRTHQKIGAKIAADEITATMDDLVVWTIEATPEFVAPPRRERMIPKSGYRFLEKDHAEKNKLNRNGKPAAISV
jgi:hypothetical protein